MSDTNRFDLIYLHLADRNEWEPCLYKGLKGISKEIYVDGFPDVLQTYSSLIQGYWLGVGDVVVGPSKNRYKVKIFLWNAESQQIAVRLMPLNGLPAVVLALREVNKYWYPVENNETTFN